jgi:zinc transport system ATP-binding protein
MKDPNQPIVLEVKHLFFSFNQIDWALQDIHLQIREKEFVGIIGPNGGGKTTFVKLLLGILQPNKGTISIYGQTGKQSRRLIGYFPQIKNVDPEYPITVREIVQSARLGNRLVTFPTKKDAEFVDQVLRTLDIYDFRERKITELSGGQRNRVFLARALACEPKILILDEPMAGLDVKLQRMFLNTLKSLNKTLTIIIVDHNLSLLEEYVDEFICLNRCVAHGTNTHMVDHSKDHPDTEQCCQSGKLEGH